MEIKEIIDDYLNGMNIYGICSKYHIGKLKVKDILLSNGIEIRKRGKQSLDKSDYIVQDFHIKKYEEEKGFHYIAIDKNNDICFNDYMNEGGLLTTHIKNTYNIKIPSLYDRRMYYMKTGNYWWEQWFDIIKEKDTEVKSCPYCDWTTIDLENKSGAYTSHILSHGITIEEHLLKYPNDKNTSQINSKRKSI